MNTHGESAGGQPPDLRPLIPKLELPIPTNGTAGILSGLQHARAAGVLGRGDARKSARPGP